VPPRAPRPLLIHKRIASIPDQPPNQSVAIECPSLFPLLFEMTTRIEENSVVAAASERRTDTAATSYLSSRIHALFLVVRAVRNHQFGRRRSQGDHPEIGRLSHLREIQHPLALLGSAPAFHALLPDSGGSRSAASESIHRQQLSAKVDAQNDGIDALGGNEDKLMNCGVKCRL